MKSGIEMMLSSMGIDPDKIKETLLQAQTSVMDEVQKVNTKLDALDAKLTRIELKLETVPPDVAMQLLADGKEQAENEVAQYVRDNSDGSSND